MRPILLFTVFAAVLTSCHKNTAEIAQTHPPIENNKALSWTKTYGGTNYDFANAVVQLTNGDFVMAGTTRSVDGDPLATGGGYDAWLTKVSSTGTKTWTRTYGANDDDYATGLAASPDGGFFITGYTFLNNQNTAWAIKTDASGNKQWQKQLSNSSDAKPIAVLATNDGAFLLVGYTSTGGNRDGWITKIDASGNSVWNKTFGGTGEDWFTSAVKSNDGGYVLTGYSNSSDGDIGQTKGNYDGWIMKIDASGNKGWSITFGGSNEDYLKSVIQTNDGGYIAVGYTKSTDGDITQNKGGYDEWLVKLDAEGSKQWIKTYGGANEEYVTSIVPTRDGNFLTMGYSNSTTGDVFRPNNNFSAWLLKFDNGGNKVAASTYGYAALYDNFTNNLITTQDGGFMLAGYSYVETRGYDAWLVKIDAIN
jgi:hypothetical protein